MGTIATRVKDAKYAAPALQALDRFITLMDESNAFPHIRTRLQQLSDNARIWQAAFHHNDSGAYLSPISSAGTEPAVGLEEFLDLDRETSGFAQEADAHTLRSSVEASSDESDVRAGVYNAQAIPGCKEEFVLSPML